MDLWKGLLEGVPKGDLPVELHIYVDKLPDVLLRSKAVGTVHTYIYQLRHWTKFADSFHMPVFPARPMDLAIFFMWLMDDKGSATVIINSYYALKWMHSFSGTPNPLDNCLVSNVVESAQRTLGKPVSLLML